MDDGREAESWAAGASYDRIAERWSADRTSLAPALVALLTRALGAIPPAPSVLDVGCGSGVPIARWLVARGCRVTGVDASARLLELAARAVPTATLLHGDLREVDPGGPFDVLVAWDSVFHVPRAEHAAVFARFSRWLRPEGALVMSLGGSAWEGTSDMHDETFFYSGHAPDESRRLLAAAGFDVMHAEIDDPTSRGHLAVLARRRAG